MDKLLVIGASGLLGGRILEMGAGKYDLFGTYGTHKVEGKNMFRLDTTKRNDVTELISRIKPDVVVDTHAMNNLDYCETHKEEAWAVNVDGVRNAAEAAQIAGAKFVFFSTDNVFDGTKQDYTEKDKPNPLNYYAMTKAVAENMLDILSINHITMRTSVLYGKGGSAKVPFVTWLCGKLRAGEKVNIVVDQHNNPTLADSVVDVTFKLLKSDATGLFHVTGSDCLSRYDFSLQIAKKFALNAKLINPITTPQLNQVARRPTKVKMNTGKAERATGLKMLSVGEGLDMLKRQLVSE